MPRAGAGWKPETPRPRGPSRRGAGPRPRRRRPGAEPLSWVDSLPLHAPSRYIAKIALGSGRELERPLSPEELLVHAHRDKHPVEIVAQFAASRALELTGREDVVRRGLRAANSLGTLAGEAAGRLLGSRTLERTARRMLGVTDRVSVLRFRETTHVSAQQAEARIETLRREAEQALRALGRGPRLVLLVTGATGFVGKEIVSQAAGDRRIAEVVALVRPQRVFDKETGKLLRVVSPEERGAELLRLLHVPARKFRFEADVSQAPRGREPACGAAPFQRVGAIARKWPIGRAGASVSAD